MVCMIYIIFFNCCRQLKYTIRERSNYHYPCHRSPSGQQVAANLVDLNNYTPTSSAAVGCAVATFDFTQPF